MDDLAAALRGWRDRMDPAAAGLTRGAPRRTPGLRREELAVLAGISIEYIVRLEQGRAVAPSAQVCLALARALQLSDQEQAHLMRLAGHAVGPGRVPRLIPGSVYRILERLEEQPVLIYDATWQLLHGNRMFAAVFGDPTVLPADQRNLLVWQFEELDDRLVFSPGERESFERSLVADLRAASGRFPRDEGLAALVARLHRIPRFAHLWESWAVEEHQSGHKVVRHPEVGDIELDSDTLTIDGSHLHVVVYTPRPGTDARGKLDLLAAVGLQPMSQHPPVTLLGGSGSVAG